MRSSWQSPQTFVIHAQGEEEDFIILVDRSSTSKFGLVGGKGWNGRFRSVERGLRDELIVTCEVLKNAEGFGGFFTEKVILVLIPNWDGAPTVRTSTIGKQGWDKDVAIVQRRYPTLRVKGLKYDVVGRRTITGNMEGEEIKLDLAPLTEDQFLIPDPWMAACGGALRSELFFPSKGRSILQSVTSPFGWQIRQSRLRSDPRELALDSTSFGDREVLCFRPLKMVIRSGVNWLVGESTWRRKGNPDEKTGLMAIDISIDMNSGIVSEFFESPKFPGDESYEFVEGVSLDSRFASVMTTGDDHARYVWELSSGRTQKLEAKRWTDVHDEQVLDVDTNGVVFFLDGHSGEIYSLSEGNTTPLAKILESR